MGCGLSLHKISEKKETISNDRVIQKSGTQWKVIPTVQDVKATTMTGMDEEAELRLILQDPVGQKYIGNFAKETVTAESFFCWVEIQEFLSVPSLSFRRVLAKHIYEKYVKTGGKMVLGGMNQKLEEELSTILNTAIKEPSVLTNELFRNVEKMCLIDMIDNTYRRFKESKAYTIYKEEIKETYNKISTDDFEYLDTLGAGGFGRVAYARKKSTGRHYAMKIQLKNGLLSEHRGDLSKLAGEKVIFQACNHPYIVDMDYSFQTSAYAIIVLALVRGGDLTNLMKQYKNRQVPEDQVTLYAAEIALALNHLHEMGLLYRDLKPSNVLLTENGHVKLADMGLAGGVDLNDATKLSEKDSILMDEEEKFQKLGPKNNLQASLSELSSIREDREDEVKGVNENENCKTVHGVAIPDKFTRAPTAKNIRRKTTVGTRGYMAPEMLRGKLMHRNDRPGYNHSVDYWSLGITIFELLCGYAPFRDVKKTREEKLQMEVDRKLGQTNPKYETELDLEKMGKGPDYPDHLSANAVSLLKRLLDTDESKRLGCTDNGFIEVMNHPFFDTIDWDKLLANHVQASYIPKVTYKKENAKTYTFEEIMHKFDVLQPDTAHEWYSEPSKEKQKYFDTWDYISTNTLKAELGIAGEMDESNRSYKVIQLTGER